MSKINIVIPVVKSNKFTGGPLCILEHAAQLTARGHDVRVIPVLPSPYPKWFKKNMGDFISTKKTDTLKKSMKALFAAIKCIPSTKNESGKLKFIQHFGRFIENIGLTFPKFTPLSLRISLRIAHLREHMRDADITFATSYETALPTALTGTGKLFYFIQHYEPYFKTESIDPFLTEKESLLSYKLGFKLITNS